VLRGICSRRSTQHPRGVHQAGEIPGRRGLPTHASKTRIQVSLEFVHPRHKALGVNTFCYRCGNYPKPCCRLRDCWRLSRSSLVSKEFEGLGRLSDPWLITLFQFKCAMGLEPFPLSGRQIDHRGIALSGVQHSATKQLFRLGRCLRLDLALISSLSRQLTKPFIPAVLGAITLVSLLLILKIAITPTAPCPVRVGPG
jgi:hypothetical protein